METLIKGEVGMLSGFHAANFIPMDVPVYKHVSMEILLNSSTMRDTYR